jgi:glycosyltransferase involved in cell wall biosynthesis
MRIVHVTEAFGGGVLSMLTELCNRAAEVGAHVTVLYSIRPETPKNFSGLFHPRVKLVYVAMCRDVHVRRDWQSVWELARHLRGCNPTVVHLHSSKAGVLGRAAAKIAAPDAKVFYSPHGLAFLRRDVSRAKQLAYLTFERMADLMGGTVVACSPGELHEIEEKVHAKDVKLIENGVNIGTIPTRKPRGDGKLFIGMNGRACFQKHHELFIDLAYSLHDAVTQFVWIGGNSKDLPDTGHHGAIDCSGWVTRARSLALMSELDVYVQTSRWEGMPVALIEAQVVGLPAVVTDVVGNRDVVVHGVTGFVASSKEEMAGYLKQLREDRQLRDRMGIAARERAVSKFSMDMIFHRWLSTYEVSGEKSSKDVLESLPISASSVQPNVDKTV